jgi:hypothetical protein
MILIMKMIWTTVMIWWWWWWYFPFFLPSFFHLSI